MTVTTCKEKWAQIEDDWEWCPACGWTHWSWEHDRCHILDPLFGHEHYEVDYWLNGGELLEFEDREGVELHSVPWDGFEDAFFSTLPREDFPDGLDEFVKWCMDREHDREINIAIMRCVTQYPNGRGPALKVG